VPEPDQEGEETNPAAINNEQRLQAQLNLALTKQVLRFDQNQVPSTNGEENPWAPSAEQLIQGQVNIGLRKTVRFDVDQTVAPWQFTEIDRRRARKNLGIVEPGEGEDGNGGGGGGGPVPVLTPEALGDMLSAAAAGGAIGLGLLALLAALFGIGKEELDIDKLRNEIVKKCVRIDIKQN
jgi:hypothetical protein